MHPLLLRPRFTQEVSRSWRRAAQALAADLQICDEGRELGQYADFVHRWGSRVVQEEHRVLAAPPHWRATRGARPFNGPLQNRQNQEVRSRKGAAAAAAGQGAQGSVRRRAAAETSDDSDLAPTLKVPRGWVCWSLHNLHNKHNEHNLHNEHNIHNLHNMHNMHNLLLGFENFPFCAARRERAFLKSPLQQPPRSSVKTLLWCFNLRSDRGGGLRNYWQFRRCIPPVPQRSDVGRHLHHIPPGGFVG